MRVLAIGVLAALLGVPAAQADSVAATKQVVRTWATAVFVLRNGKNRRCDAPGGKVAAVFRISGGKIRAWAEIPVPKPQRPTA